MRVRHGTTECAQCGASLDVEEPRRVRAGLVSTSGEPTIRVLMLDGVEIHRCTLTALPRLEERRVGELLRALSHQWMSKSSREPDATDRPGT